MTMPDVKTKPYRFTWDEEPSDEQLAQIMREIGQDVREQTIRLQKMLKEQLRLELEVAHKERAESSKKMDPSK